MHADFPLYHVSVTLAMQESTSSWKSFLSSEQHSYKINKLKVIIEGSTMCMYSYA